MKSTIFAVIAVTLGVAGLFYVMTADDDRPRRQGLVIESSNRTVTPIPSAAPARAPAAVSPADPAPAVSVAVAPVPAAPALRADNRIVIGRISTNVRKHWPRLEAMANYLSAELADVGIAGVDVRMVDTTEEMRELLRSGEIDLLSETAFSAIELTQDNTAEMLLREWKSGVSEYHTVIFARRDSGIASLADLIGRSFVFEDRGSTSAYLVPRAHMVRSGFNMVELDNPLDRPPQGAIGFAFAEDEGTVVSRVRRGFADAGAISNLDWSDEDEVSEDDRRELVVVHETDPVIRSILLVRSTLDPAVKDRLAQVLMQMHETEAGLETLREYWKVARFDRLEGAALESLLNARVMHQTSQSF